MDNYTLAQKSLAMMVTFLVMVATSLVMVATSLVMVEKLVEKRCDGSTYLPTDMGRC